MRAPEVTIHTEHFLWGGDGMPSLKEQIQKLKEEKDAVILAHYYESDEIQEIADFTGDSLYLAQAGKTCPEKVVLMAGVVFMAEGIKLLSPDKTVIVPDLNAGCSLVHHSPFEKYKAWKEKHSDGILVTYINSSAAVKSISDIICTSSNAEKIINSIPKDRKILFGPDRNLGAYLSRKLNREMELWPGACEVHVLFSAKKLFELKNQNPDAVVLAHPECIEAVLEYADVIGSTSRLIEEVKNNPAQKFIVATEPGVFYEMKKHRTDVELIPAPSEGHCHCNECPYMKLNNLDKIYFALESLSPQVIVEEKYFAGAQKALNHMLELS